MASGDLQSIPTKHSQQADVSPPNPSPVSKKRLLPLPSNRLNKRMDTKLMSSPMYSNSEFHYNKENLVQTSPIKKDHLSPKNLKDFNLNSKQLLDIIQTPRPLIDAVGNDSSVNKYLIFSDKDSIHNNSIHMSDGVEIQSQNKLGGVPSLPVQRIHTQPLDSGDDSPVADDEDDDNLLPSNFVEDLDNEHTAKFLNSKMYSQDFIEQLKQSHHSQVSNLNSQLSSKDQKISELELALVQAKTELRNSEIEIKDINYHNAKLLKVSNNQQSKYQSLVKSFDELKEKLEKSEIRNNELVDQVSSLQEKGIKANDDIDLLNKENNKLNNQLNLLATDNNELIKHVEDLQLKNEELSNAYQTLKQKLDFADEQNITKDQEIASLNKELDSIKSSIKNLKEEYSNTREQDSKENDSLRSECNAIKNENSRLLKEITEKQNLIGDFEEEIKNLNSIKQDLISKIEELTQSNNGLVNKNSDDLNKLLAEKEDLDSQLQQSFYKISQFQSQLTELNEENSILHDKLNQMNKQLENLSNISNENKKLLETLEDLKKENERLNKLTEKYNKVNYKKLMNEFNKLKTHLTGMETSNLEMNNKFSEMSIRYHSIVDQISIYQQELQLIKNTE